MDSAHKSATLSGIIDRARYHENVMIGYVTYKSAFCRCVSMYHDPASRHILHTILERTQREYSDDVELERRNIRYLILLMKG